MEEGHRPGLRGGVPCCVRAYAYRSSRHACVCAIRTTYAHMHTPHPSPLTPLLQVRGEMSVMRLDSIIDHDVNVIKIDVEGEAQFGGLGRQCTKTRLGTQTDLVNSSLLKTKQRKKKLKYKTNIRNFKNSSIKTKNSTSSFKTNSAL